MCRLIGLITLALLLSITQRASAGPFEYGLAAAERGDFATALSVYSTLINAVTSRPD